MPKNVLDELHQTNTVPANAYADPPIETPQTDPSLDQFFQEISWILEAARSIETTTDRLRKKYSEIISSPQQNDEIKREITALTESIEATSSKIHLKLKQMNKEILEQYSQTPDSASVKVQETQCRTATRRFLDAMAIYRNSQMDYSAACKAQIKLKFEIAEHPVSDEELDRILESDSLEIFTQGILMNTQQARQNLADIEARHVDILKLEKSIKELHGMFLEIAALVDSQNELFDRIDHNVADTKDHVEGAVEATRKAVVYHKKTRKKKIIIIVIVVVVLVILVAILIGTLVKR